MVSPKNSWMTPPHKKFPTFPFSPKRRGAVVVDRNVRVGRDEIDLIARIDDRTVAVEVKTGLGPGTRPWENFDDDKNERVRRAARALEKVLFKYPDPTMDRNLLVVQLAEAYRHLGKPAGIRKLLTKAGKDRISLRGKRVSVKTILSLGTS